MPEPGTSAPEHAPLANGTCARVKRVLVCLDEGDRRGGGGMGPVCWEKRCLMTAVVDLRLNISSYTVSSFSNIALCFKTISLYSIRLVFMIYFVTYHKVYFEY